MIDTEIRIYTMSRSGHHAVMHWLLDRMPEPTLWINNPIGNHNPRIYPHGIDEEDAWKMMKGGKVHDLKVFMFNIELPLPLKEIVREVEQPSEKRQKLSRKVCLNHTWQNCGEANEVIDVILMRDVLNHAASWSENKSEDVIDFWFDKWREIQKSLYREILTGSVLEDPVILLYNSWFRSAQYRQRLQHDFPLSGDLKAPQTELALEGNRSSFDNPDDYENRAHQMDVTGRWRGGNTRFMKAVAEDEQLIRCCDHVFGHLHPIKEWAEEIKQRRR